MNNTASSKVVVVKVPSCGYVVVGRGTYNVGHVVDTSGIDPAEIAWLIDDGYIRVLSDQP